MTLADVFRDRDVSARRSAFLRTDAFGAGLIGLILMSLAGLIFFLRLMALVRSL